MGWLLSRAAAGDAPVEGAKSASPDNTPAHTEERRSAARAADAESVLDSVRFFVIFFLGTAVYFLPVPLVGAFKSARILRTMGRLAAGIIGLYYFYVGLVAFYGGIL